jgi:hypothetical protein
MRFLPRAGYIAVVVRGVTIGHLEPKPKRIAADGTRRPAQVLALLANPDGTVQLDGPLFRTRRAAAEYLINNTPMRYRLTSQGDSE